MPIPSTTQQLLITLLLVIPGFVYQQVRIRFRGRLPSDIELTSRLLRAIATSTIFALAYATAASWRYNTYDQARAEAAQHLSLTALLAFLAAFVVPSVVALATASRPGRWLASVTDKVALPSTAYDPRPSAWDVAFHGIRPGFIRVRMKDGTWFAGYFGENSYASSFPDPKSLYLELSYGIDEHGTITGVTEGSRGAVIDCTDAVLIEIVDTPSSDGGAQLAPGE